MAKHSTKFNSDQALSLQGTDPFVFSQHTTLLKQEDIVFSSSLVINSKKLDIKNESIYALKGTCLYKCSSKNRFMAQSYLDVEFATFSLSPDACDINGTYLHGFKLKKNGKN